MNCDDDRIVFSFCLLTEPVAHNCALLPLGTWNLWLVSILRAFTTLNYSILIDKNLYYRSRKDKDTDWLPPQVTPWPFLAQMSVLQSYLMLECVQRIFGVFLLLKTFCSVIDVWWACPLKIAGDFSNAEITLSTWALTVHKIMWFGEEANAIKFIISTLSHLNVIYESH